MKKNIKGLNYKFLKNIVLSSSLGFCAACNHESIFNQDEAKPTPDDNKDQKDTTKLKENTTEKIDPSKNVEDTNNEHDPQIKPSTTSDETKPKGQPNIDSGNDGDTDPESSSKEKDSDNDGDASDSEIDNSITSEEDSDESETENSDPESSSTEKDSDNDTDTSDSEIDNSTTSEENEQFIELLEQSKNATNELLEIAEDYKFLNKLNEIKETINKISNRNIKNKAFKYLKDNINFEFKNNDDNEICFSCNKLFIKDINNTFRNFVNYCDFSRKLMEIIGCEDIYKIDLSLCENWNALNYQQLKEIPKKYFSNDKIFHFNVNNGNISAGWGNEIKNIDKGKIDNIVENLLFIQDLNSSLVGNSFDFDKVLFNEVEYLQEGCFKFKFSYNDLEVYVEAPIGNFLKNFKFNSINWDWDRWFVTFLDVNGNLLLKYHYYNDPNYLDFLEDKNISIKNRATISINNDSIFFSDIEKSPISFSLMHENINDFKFKLKFLQKLKNCNLIKINNVNLDLGTDGKILKLGEFDFLNFIKKTQSDAKKISIYDVSEILDYLFNIFGTSASAKYEYDPLMKEFYIHIYKDNKIYTYTFDEDNGVLSIDNIASDDETSSSEEF